MADAGTCRGCGERILWAVTENGRRIPLNKPEKRFVLKEGMTRIRATMVDTYVSHFATCTCPERFRKA